jgi:Protein of unknown function (DUF1501)
MISVLNFEALSNGHFLMMLGIDHKKLTYRFQGRNFRLTDREGNVITKILA